METNQNDYNENEQTNDLQGIRTGRAPRKERVKQKAKEVLKIIGSVIGHQFKIAFIISVISLIVIIFLCSAAWYVLQGNSMDALLELFSM